MKAVLIRSARGLHGSTPDDDAAWQKFRRKLATMKPGTWLRFEWSSPRNGAHHRKFFALLTLITENSETYTTTAQALVAVKLVTGYADPVLNPLTGELTQIPRSISYESMSQEDFDAFYDAAIDGVVRHILPQFDRATADRLIDMVLQGWA